MTRVEIAHDYLTQRGGAERVVLEIARTFPGAAVHTSLYEPDSTFPEFAELDVRASALNRITVLRRDHRRALPLLAPTFSLTRVDADVVICSSSGWAHGIRTEGRKLVYCHNPARWLYQPDDYSRELQMLPRAAAKMLSPVLRRWDGHAARSADLYLANSRVVRDRIADAYGLEAEVLHPPPALSPQGPAEPPADLEPGYLLCVTRLLPYKNVDVVIAIARSIRDRALVVVGEGPDEARLRELARHDRVVFLGGVPDSGMRWLYANASLLISAAHEDFGLATIEAAAFGCPTVAPRAGGFLDTVVESETGLLFGTPTAKEGAAAVRRALAREWDPLTIRSHSDRFDSARFRSRLAEVVEELV